MSSTTDIICIYSQNVQKNYVLVDSLLESQKDLYDILFIQEPPCYESRLKGLSQETTLVLSNTRELNRVPSTEQSTLYTNSHGLC